MNGTANPSLSTNWNSLILTDIRLKFYQGVAFSCHSNVVKWFSVKYFIIQSFSVNPYMGSCQHPPDKYRYKQNIYSKLWSLRGFKNEFTHYPAVKSIFACGITEALPAAVSRCKLLVLREHFRCLLINIRLLTKSTCRVYQHSLEDEFIKT